MKTYTRCKQLLAPEIGSVGVLNIHPCVRRFLLRMLASFDLENRVRTKPTMFTCNCSSARAGPSCQRPRAKARQRQALPSQSPRLRQRSGLLPKRAILNQARSALLSLPGLPRLPTRRQNRLTRDQFWQGSQPLVYQHFCGMQRGAFGGLDLARLRGFGSKKSQACC